MGMRPNYGIDAPSVVLNLFVAGFGSLFLSLVPGIPTFLAAILPWIGGAWVITGFLMFTGSSVLKLRLRDKIVNSLGLIGDETVLDMGCGRGLMLIGMAKRLPNGKAVGIDLWDKSDQSGNKPEATLQNAKIENVENRIELKTGDMRSSPFAHQTFDCVVSTWAIHNIANQEGRETAILEAVRLLKPGGKLIIADIIKTKEYVSLLESLNMSELKVSRPNFLFFVPTRVISAVKPARANVDKILTLS